MLGDRDTILNPGEAQLDIRVPHAFGTADSTPVEMLGLFGRQGKYAHLLARTTPRSTNE